MTFVKFLFFSVLTTIILFFVWNIMKRIFFTKFYNYFPHQKQNNEKKDNSKKNSSRNKNENLNWDAETIEYEEVK